MNTLLVDDNLLFRRTVRKILAAAFPSMGIQEAGDGREVLQLIGRRPPELVLMDIQLPGVSGLVLTQEIKERFPQVIVAVFTQYDIPEYREAAYQCGADHFMVKGSTRATDILKLAASIDSGSVPASA
jgi:DNA-binding NarL/FixJ family response regulator